MAATIFYFSVQEQRLYDRRRVHGGPIGSIAAGRSCLACDISARYPKTQSRAEWIAKAGGVSICAKAGRSTWGFTEWKIRSENIPAS